MKTNAKLLSLSFTVVALTAAITTWKFVDFYCSDSKSKEQFLVQQQVKTLAEAVSIQSDFTIEKLLKVVAKEDYVRFQKGYPKVREGLARSTQSSPFVFVAAITAKNHPKWVAFGKRRSETWTQGDISSVLEKFSFSEARENRTAWHKVMGPRSRAYLALGVEVKKKSGLEKIFGLLPIEYLTRVGAILKGSSDLFMVVDSRGRALYFPEQQYLGATVTDDPIVKEILAHKNKMSGSGEYRNLDGVSSAGAYYRIGSTNMHAILSRPFQSVSAPYAEFVVEVLISVFVICLAVAAVFGLFWNTIGVKMDYVRKSLANMVNGIPIAQPPIKDGESTYLYSMMTQVERRVGERAEDKMQSVLLKESFRTFKSTIENVFVALRDPVTAILGHSQLIQNELKADVNSKAREKAVKIEEESRSIRDWTERLQHLSDINVDNVDPSALSTWIDEVKMMPEKVDFNFDPVVLSGIQSRWEMEEKPKKEKPLMEVLPTATSSESAVEELNQGEDAKASTQESVPLEERLEDESLHSEAFQSSPVETLKGKTPLDSEDAAFLPELPGKLKFVHKGEDESVIKNELVEKEIERQLSDPDSQRIQIEEESLDLSELDDFVVTETTDVKVNLRKPHVRTET